MKIFFSLVLYNHTVPSIEPLLSSIGSLQSTYFCLDCKLFLYDASQSRFSTQEVEYLTSLAHPVDIDYFSGPNIGYGMANNANFTRITEDSPFLFVVVNPDVYFSPESLYPLLEWAFSNPSVSCTAPLIVNHLEQIQYSAKRNPTFLSLLLGRFSVLERFKPFLLYAEWHKHLHLDYSTETVVSTYLSGCFLLIPGHYFRAVGGFSSSFFLHLEDADLVRKLSSVGLTVHNPLGKVYHLWARGSHKSLLQMWHLTNSYFSYIKAWGFDLF